MARRDPLVNKLVVLIGGGGFLGRHVAEELLKREARLRIAGRHPEQAHAIRPLANLGQIQFSRCDVNSARSIEAAVNGADAVVYLVGTFGANQEAVQATGAARAAQAAAAQGAGAFVYVSAIGADPESETGYASTKAQGEAQVLAAFPGATVLRPSILFGEDDEFINLFARAIAAFPAIPVFGGAARLQPLYVDDAAQAVAEVLSNPEPHRGRTYELAGPEVFTMADLHRRIASAQGRERALLPVPDALGALFVALPGTPMNSEQWKLLQRGSVAAGDLPGIAELGITPRPLSLFLDRWMARYRKRGRFGDKREPAEG
jgi:NADH dehydrogenase